VDEPIVRVVLGDKSEIYLGFLSSCCSGRARCMDGVPRNGFIAGVAFFFDSTRESCLSLYYKSPALDV